MSFLFQKHLSSLFVLLCYPCLCSYLDPFLSRAPFIDSFIELDGVGFDGLFDDSKASIHWLLSKRVLEQSYHRDSE